MLLRLTGSKNDTKNIFITDDTVWVSTLVIQQKILSSTCNVPSIHLLTTLPDEGYRQPQTQGYMACAYQLRNMLIFILAPMLTGYSSHGYMSHWGAEVGRSVFFCQSWNGPKGHHMVTPNHTQGFGEIMRASLIQRVHPALARSARRHRKNGGYCCISGRWKV